MKLYYSGASNFEDSQFDINKALGNYISSDELPNDRLGATFRSVTSLVKSRNDKQVFMLILKNTTGSAVTNVTIFTTYPQDGESNDIGKYKVELAFVTPTTDGDGNPVFEKIASSNSLPLTGSFAEYNRTANEIDIGSINDGDSVGIWFKATLVPANNVVLTDQQLYDNFTNAVTLDTEEEISMSITYT